MGDEKAARLVTDRGKYRRGEPVRFQLRFIDERSAPTSDRKATIMFERQEGQSRRPISLSQSSRGPSLFEGQATKLPEGRYHAWVVEPALPGDPAADFEVLPAAGEMERSQMNLAELTRSSSDTRGKFYRFGDARRLFDDLPEGHPVPIETLPPVPLWNKWPVLLLFLCLLSGEWLLRRKKGML